VRVEPNGFQVHLLNHSDTTAFLSSLSGNYLKNNNNKFHTIYKQTNVFVLIFFMLLFWFISKAATTKNRQFVYYLSMLCLGLAYVSIEIKKTQISLKNQIWYVILRF
jgi:cell division protein FtsW (lipid II flippase)